MASKVNFLRTYLERQKGQKLQVEQTIDSLQTELQETKRDLLRHEQAREIIRTVGQKTQQELQYHISDITSLAMEAVFTDPYALKVDFVQRRNKTECDLLFVRDEAEIEPLSASGGGTVDVASFALRIASWSMAHPKSMNVIALDEPLRFLSSDCQERASAMIKEISAKLGIQFIIVTHEETLATSADRTFEVIKKGKKSKVIQS
jgi:DNA repair exonuclease SbcCD ATPase subunit